MPFLACYKSLARGIGYPPEEIELGRDRPSPFYSALRAHGHRKHSPARSHGPGIQKDDSYRPRVLTWGMARQPIRLSPRHRQGIRAIVSGLPVQDAATWIGLSLERMSTVYRSPAGQAFALHLEALANDYVARMLALGITPQHIASAVGGGKHASQCKPPSRKTRQRHEREARERGAEREAEAE